MNREELIHYIERNDPFRAEKVALFQLSYTQLVIIKTQVELEVRKKSNKTNLREINTSTTNGTG